MDDWLFIPSIITAGLAFVSPGLAMIAARSVRRYAPYSYAFGLTSCALWIYFGRHYELNAMWGLSSFGAVAYAGYLAAFLRVSDAQDPRRQWLLTYVLGGSVAVLFTGLLLGVFASQASFDNFCSTVAGFASIAPLWNLPAVYRTKTTDSMPSPIVAGFILLNAVILIFRNIFRVKHVNLNLAIPACIALISAVVQLLLHLACWCLQRQPLVPPAVDTRRLLDEDALAEDNETRVDVASLKQMAQVSNKIDDLPLHHDGHHEIDHANNETKNNLQLLLDGHHAHHEISHANNGNMNLQHLQDGHRAQQKIAHDNNKIKNLQLAPDGHRGDQEIAQAYNEIKNLQLPQDGQHGGQEEKKEEPTDPVDVLPQDDAISAAEVKLAQTVKSDDKVNHPVDPAVPPQQGEKA